MLKNYPNTVSKIILLNLNHKFIMAKTNNTIDKENVSAAIVLAKALDNKAKPWLKKIEAFKQIKTSEDFDVVAGYLKTLKDIGKEADAQKASIIDPLKASMKAVDSLFKPFKDGLALTEANTKALMGNYLALVESKKEKLEEKLESGSMKVSTFHKKTSELTTSSANAKVRTLQQLKITRASLIPREFLVPDESKITEALKAGKKVPGCTLEEVKNIAIG